MKLYDVFNLLESEVAPVALSDEFCALCNAYDNSGVLIENDGEITGIVFSLDFSVDAVNVAKEKGYNLIVTHHPAIYNGVYKITPSGDPLSAAIAECIRHGIGVISMHLNFDSANEGIDYHLMRGVGGREAQLSHKLSCGGYGRSYEIPAISFGDLCEKVKREFNTDRAEFYGDKDKQIRKVASFCGAGVNGTEINFALKQGVQAVVSSDMPHHIITEFYYRGICVIKLTHYSSEVYGFSRIAEKIISKLPFPAEIFVDNGLM
ncbi:MAG: Nif3-like dinuclear metal center hexameric protein [Candidatus Coproplasma sp.]